MHLDDDLQGDLNQYTTSVVRQKQEIEQMHRQILGFELEMKQHSTEFETENSRLTSQLQSASEEHTKLIAEYQEYMKSTAELEVSLFLCWEAHKTTGLESAWEQNNICRCVVRAAAAFAAREAG